MVIKRVVDSNILIYALLTNHPAYLDCSTTLQKYDTEGMLYSTADSLDELYHVMKAFYQIKTQEIIQHIENLLESNLNFEVLSVNEIQTSIKLASQEKIDLNDAKLITLAQRLQSPVIITDDKKLGKLAEKAGLLLEFPIREETRLNISAWEMAHLPPKGFPRFLNKIYQYLASLNPEIAQQLAADSKGFKKIPEPR